MSRFRIWLLCVVFCLAGGGQLAYGQDAQDQPAPNADLSKLSVEDLMNVNVTSASDKEQKLSRVAAAVFVISQDDIRRSGATNIPDLLRMVPGLDVAQINGSTWAISSRGFNGQYSNKLLVQVDGRVVYTPTFAGVYWDVQDVPLQNIDRIEVIRGPGGTIWGANAVNGVISIFTKKAAETQGVLVEAGGGTISPEFGTVQYGGKVNAGTQYRAYMKYFNDNQLPGAHGLPAGDGWDLLSGGFRVDSTLSAKDQLMVEGTAYDGQLGQYAFSQLGVLPQPSLAIHEDVRLQGGSIQAAWNHTISDRADSTLQFSYGGYLNGVAEREANSGFDLDYKFHVAVGARHDVVAGFGYNHSDDSFRGTFSATFDPLSRGLQVVNGFVQDEITLLPDRLYLTAGTKLENNSYTGFGVIPSLRLAWEPTARQMFWAAVSRALRTPSRSDTEATANIDSFLGPGGVPIVLRFLGNPNFQNEALVAYEAGYRTSLSDRISIDLALYFNNYDHLATVEPGTPFLESTPLPVHLVEPELNENLMHGNTEGIEVAAKWKLTKRWTLSPGYAFEEIHMHPALASHDMTSGVSLEHNAPRHSAQLRSQLDLVHGFGWNNSIYFVDSLTDQGLMVMSEVPAYTRLDSELSWKIGKQFSISVVGQNLLQDHHLEFLGTLGGIQSSEMKRSAYIKFVWTLR